MVAKTILIADGGSTKTDWSIVSGNREIDRIRTGGINPFFQTEEEISAEIRDNLIPRIRECIRDRDKGVRFCRGRLLLWCRMCIHGKERDYTPFCHALSAGPGGGRQRFAGSRPCPLWRQPRHCLYFGDRFQLLSV